MTLSLTLITPERQFHLAGLRQVVFQSPQGETGILPGHAACITLTTCGVLRAFRADARESAPPACFAVGNGSLRLTGDHLVMLVKRLCHQNELDADTAFRDLEALQRRMSTLDPVLDLETFNDCMRAAAFCEACIRLDREIAAAGADRQPPGRL